ncbi:MAG: aminomethyl-transferring glycine dehydrogenase subunit GcvPB [Candidatus Lernaella stagnicola]|nr:aminomethyl-transferring glycine dehydrogenase subunit GcvPB [Candidatus Lernaella stagnicola]
MSKSYGPCDTPGSTGLALCEPTLFERSTPGRQGFSLPSLDVPEAATLPENLQRLTPAAWPEVSEVEVFRHFVRLSQYNYGLDSGLYPLGSCTMKYNPKINEDLARLPGFADAHPAAEHQGLWELIFNLEQHLAEISGMDAVTCQPAAGAHGELTGMMLIRAYHEARGQKRTKVIIPDTAHGTNPASATICNYDVVPLKSGAAGILTPEAVAEIMDDQVAAIMITNPNTLGLFESNIAQIAQIVHDQGGLVYMDGANLNAIMGITRPGDFGIDVLHFNLHKTFSTPHGGGGPGAGPVGVKKHMAPFLPAPVIVKRDGGFALDHDRPQTIGRVRSWWGNVGVLVRAYAYIRELGAPGLKASSEMAVLNANYIRARLQDLYTVAYEAPCMHEVVFAEKGLPNDVSTMDVAKRLIDYGFHPPTVYFPLVVKGAIMVEPTESFEPESLDGFITAMRNIHAEAGSHPELVKSAPHNTTCKKVDEVTAARHPRLTADMDPDARRA